MAKNWSTRVKYRLMCLLKHLSVRSATTLHARQLKLLQTPARPEKPLHSLTYLVFNSGLLSHNIARCGLPRHFLTRDYRATFLTHKEALHKCTFPFSPPCLRYNAQSAKFPLFIAIILYAINFEI